MHHRLRLAGLLATTLALASAAPASAHEELVASEPAAGAALDAPPSEVVLTFSGELTPESDFIVFGPSDDEIGTGELDLEVADRNVLRGEGVDAGAGTYTVRWTAVSADGHAQQGTLTWVVGSAQQPNTALMQAPWTALVGLTLLTLALVIGLGRRRARGTL